MKQAYMSYEQHTCTSDVISYRIRGFAQHATGILKTQFLPHRSTQFPLQRSVVWGNNSCLYRETYGNRAYKLSEK